MMSAFESRGSVTLVDVSMRDGLQDETVVLDTSAKLEIAAALSASGLSHIEATSFVHPKWVPQLADADDFVPLLPKGPHYSALVLNMRGWERAVAAFERASIAPGSYDLVFVTSASERHAVSNNNATIEKTLTMFDEIAAAQQRPAYVCELRLPVRSFHRGWTSRSPRIASPRSRHASRAGTCTR